MKQFIHKTRSIYNISDQALDLLLNIFIETKQRKGTVIVREGDSTNDIIFLKQGFSRAYINQDGKEVTVWFASSGSPTGAYHGSKSILNIELLEESTLLIASRSKLEVLFEQNIELANWGRKIAEHYLEINIHHFSHYNGLEGKDKYELLLKEYPEVFQKAAIKHIASYLNITPQSLSRIRGVL